MLPGPIEPLIVGLPLLLRSEAEMIDRHKALAATGFGRFGLTELVSLWIIAMCGGVTILAIHENTPGRAVHPSGVDASILHPLRDLKVPNLFVFLHPMCPCSTASVGEPARLMTVCRGKLSVTVPAGGSRAT
jgi:hypothetical protein